MQKRACLRLVLLLAASAVLPSCSKAAEYDTKVPFRRQQAVTFPDFVLTYLGERRKAAPPYPRDFIYHDFRVVTTRGEQTVSWSAGTGAIGPANFRVGDREFLLELHYADKLGKLKDNEVVVRRAP